MQSIIYHVNEVIFKQGSFDSCMYSIAKGRVGIFTDYGTGAQKRIAELDKDQFFGEIGLIGCMPRTATAVSLEDGTVLHRITGEDLSEYFKDKPEMLLKLMKQLSHRLRVTTQNYVDACRTIYENDRAQQNGDPRSAWIAEHMDLFSEEYINSSLS